MGKEVKLMTNALEFGAYLKELRKLQSLTIRQLEDKSGVSNAYLSQLENGKRGIPSPEILKKIHKPLDVDYDQLMEKAGYITPDMRSELLPETLKTIDSYEALSELVQNAKDIYFQNIQDNTGILKEKYKNYFMKEIAETNKNMSEQEIENMISQPNFLSELFDHLTIGERINLLNILIKGFVEDGVDPSTVFKSKERITKEHSVPFLRVPILGHIAAGNPILAEDHIDEWTDIPNLWNLKESEAIVLKVKGDSMIGSRIYEGDKVVIKLQPEVENGEIAVVNINGDEATLKRVKKTENGQVILYPDNPNYEPTFVTNENARIIGKVIQVMFEPK